MCKPPTMNVIESDVIYVKRSGRGEGERERGRGRRKREIGRGRREKEYNVTLLSTTTISSRTIQPHYTNLEPYIF